MFGSIGAAHPSQGTLRSHTRRFHRILSVLPFLILLFVVSCRNDRVGTLGPGEFAAGLRDDPEKLLHSMQPRALRNVVRLGTEWPMVVALIADSFDRDSLMEPLLESGYVWSEGEVRFAYGIELAAHRFDRGRYEASRAVATSLAEEFPDRPGPAFLRLRSEVRLGRYRRALVLLEEMEAFDVQGLSGIERQDLGLMRIIISASLGGAGWEHDLLDLCTAHHPSQVHRQAFAFLTESRRGNNAVAPEALSLLQAMAAASAGETANAYRLLLRKVFPDDGVERAIAALGALVYRAPVLELITTTYGFNGNSRGAYEVTVALAAAAPRPAERRVAWFHAGRAARALRWYAVAADCFERALPAEGGTDQAGLDEQIDRRIWYLIDTVRLLSPVRSIELVERFGGKIDRRSYFDDTFEEILGELLRTADYESVHRACTAFLEHGGAYVRALSAYVSAGLHALQLRRPERGIDSELMSLVSTARAAPGFDVGSSYYRIVAGGTALPHFDADFPAGPGTDAEGDPETEEAAKLRRRLSEMSWEERVLETLLELGYASLSHEWILRHDGRVSPGLILSAAVALQSSGEFADSMRIADRYVPLFAGQGNEADVDALLRVGFPMAYREPLFLAADRAGVPKGLFYALVREESYFQPAVKSHAGAVGLSQLLPTTAEEVADRMGMRAVDLTRPEDNLTIGAEYLAYCIRLFDSELLGLTAYNAGLGRVRRWLDQFGDLPLALFVEAIPIEETRHYVRKVVRSMTLYAELYPDIEPALGLPVVLPGIDSATASAVGE